MKFAGCVVTVDWVVYGCGKTRREALQEFETTLQNKDVQIIDEHTDVSKLKFGPQYIYQEDIEVLPATDALLQAVQDYGGDVAWTQQGGIACLPSEI